MSPSAGIGPALPEHIVRSRMANEALKEEDEEKSIVDVGAIGPLLPGNEVVEELRHFSESFKALPSGQPDKLERESWMTDYLPVSANPLTALKPRKFRQGAASAGDIDASWFTVYGSRPSDSPSASTIANIPRPDPHSKLLQDVAAARDNTMFAIANEYNKKHKRDESLLERHQRKLTKEAEKTKRNGKKIKRRGISLTSNISSSSSSRSSSDSSSGDDRKKHKHRHKKRKKSKDKKKKKSKRNEEVAAPTRQPFDRDRDLFASRIDPLKRKAIIERSKSLGSRFAHGGQKFL
ncbi:unnamed protein product [Hymenolepis diminuta]|uniref:DUF3752 domain-containing protein n=1 Tax=Hymenolepis diminuta TaxID=6216 RepID=A0A564Y7J1_HYMDI|nr:unnamed protein product [Hymenolepis diminuta]